MTAVPQHLQALKRANYVRQRTAEIRRAIRAGDVNLADAVRGTIGDDDADEMLASRPVIEILTCGHRIGEKVAKQITTRASIPPDLPLRGLSAARREQLATVVAQMAPWTTNGRTR